MPCEGFRKTRMPSSLIVLGTRGQHHWTQHSGYISPKEEAYHSIWSDGVFICGDHASVICSRPKTPTHLFSQLGIPLPCLRSRLGKWDWGRWLTLVNHRHISRTGWSSGVLFPNPTAFLTAWQCPSLVEKYARLMDFSLQLNTHLLSADGMQILCWGIGARLQTGSKPCS